MNRLICHWVNPFAMRQHVYASLYLERTAQPTCGNGGAIAGEFLCQMREGIIVG